MVRWFPGDRKPLPRVSCSGRMDRLQGDLAARFAEGDRRAGVPFLAMVLMEEVGEFAEAARRGETDAQAEEIADVAFIALSIANVLGVDVEARVRAKFLEREKGDVTSSWTDVPE